MQIIATAEQMRGFDRKAIRKYAVPGLLLMENAGRAFVETAQPAVGSWEGLKVFLFCGRGNNGGDGFVIARHLANRGAQATVFLPGRKTRVKGDAAANLRSVIKLAAEPESGVRFVELNSMRPLAGAGNPDVIIDALVGTGFSGSLDGLYRRLAIWINKKKSRVLSVDLPSGVNADNGVVESVAVKADMTITMGLAKVGHYVGAGRDHTGALAIVDIGIPEIVLKTSSSHIFRVMQSDVRRWLPQRSVTAHKHSVGKIFILAGSRGLTGAPYMTAQSAMKTGAGAVVLGVPRSIYPILAKKTDEVMVTPLEETPEGSVAASSRKEILERSEWADVVVVGPGLSRNAETQKMLPGILREIRKPLVLDADGLVSVGLNPTSLRSRRGPTVLTPHVGEMSRMTGKKGSAIEILRVEHARTASAEFRSVLVLKGSPTVTATPGGEVFLNPTGNPGMATAGSGDVLTGIIAGLIGQGLSAEEAAVSGVFVHGVAGDIASNRFGIRGMLAMDILNSIPDGLKQIEA